MAIFIGEIRRIMRNVLIAHAVFYAAGPSRHLELVLARDRVRSPGLTRLNGALRCNCTNVTATWSAAHALRYVCKRYEAKIIYVARRCD